MVETVTVWLVATLGLSARSEEMIASQATDTKTCLLDYFSPLLHRDALEFLALLHMVLVGAVAPGATSNISSLLRSN
jgi:hypothetical protein